MQDKFQELMKKKTETTKKISIDAVEIGGAFKCNECSVVNKTARYERNARMIVWECECGVVGRVEGVGLDI